MESLLGLFEIHLSNPWVGGLLNSGIVVLIFAMILAASNRFFRPAVRKLISAFDNRPDENIISAFLRLIRRVIVLVGIGIALSTLPLPPKIEIFIHNTVFAVVAFFILLGLFDLSNIIGLLVRARAPEFEILSNRILKIIFATVVLMITMRHFDYDIWHIMTALGVGTLAVGLAAQPTLTNMIAGFTILIDRPFRRGDRVALSTGETGDVDSIGMRSTQILNTDGNMLIVSNSELVNTRLINYSFPNNSISQKLKFYVSNDGRSAEAKALLKEVTQKVPGITPNSVTALLTGFTEWGTEIAVTFNVEHFTRTGQTADAVIDAAITEFQKHGIKLATNPYPPLPKS